MIAQPPQFFHGYKVVIQPDWPKMQLSADCPVSDDFRIKVNKWMIEFFGYQPNMIPDGQAVKLEMVGQIHMNPRTYERFQKALDSGVTVDARTTP